MKTHLPTEQEVLQRAQPHLERFKLGMMFESCEVKWTGPDARNLMLLIQEICWVLDQLGPNLLDEVCAQVREAAGLPAQRGMILRSYVERSFHQLSYGQQMKPLCDALRTASEGGASCAWRQEGCVNMISIIEDLIHKSTRVMPAAIDQMRNTPAHQIPISIEGMSVA